MANKTTLSKSLEQLADEVVYAQNTLSEYYTIGTIKVRYSDHMAADPDCDLALFSNTVNKRNVYIIIPTVGLFKEVQWFSKVEDVIDFIKRFESVARLLIKKPTENDNKRERLISNALSSTAPLKTQYGNAVPAASWHLQLRFIYKTNDQEVKDLINEIARLTGMTESIIARIKKFGPLTMDERKAALKHLLEQIKEEAKQ